MPSKTKNIFHRPLYDDGAARGGLSKVETIVLIIMVSFTTLCVVATWAITDKGLENQRRIKEEIFTDELNAQIVIPLDCKCEVNYCPCPDTVKKICPDNPLMPIKPQEGDDSLSKCYQSCDFTPFSCPVDFSRPIEPADDMVDSLDYYFGNSSISLQDFIAEEGLTWSSRYRRLTNALEHYYDKHMRIMTRRHPTARLKQCTFCKPKGRYDYIQCIMKNYNNLKKNYDRKKLIAQEYEKILSDFSNLAYYEGYYFELGAKKIRLPTETNPYYIYERVLNFYGDYDNRYGLTIVQFENFYETLRAFSLDIEGGGRCKLCPEVWPTDDAELDASFWKTYGYCIKYGSRFHLRTDVEAMKKEGYTWKSGNLYYTPRDGQSTLLIS